MDYYDPMNELDDKNNPYLLGYVDATIQIFNHVYAELAGANARCETLDKLLTKYQDELIPGYRERAEKAERERDALKARYCGGEPCEVCLHRDPNIADCNGDCLACSLDCLCNTCCEYSNWEYDEWRED